MSWAYAEACANRLANQGMIPMGLPVWLAPRRIKGGFCFSEHLPKRGFGPRRATVSLTPLLDGRIYVPHGEGAF